MEETRNVDLDFLELNVNSLLKVILLDASFANAPGTNSIMEFFMLIVDEIGINNIIYYKLSCYYHNTRLLMPR